MTLSARVSSSSSSVNHFYLFPINVKLFFLIPHLHSLLKTTKSFSAIFLFYLQFWECFEVNTRRLRRFIWQIPMNVICCYYFYYDDLLSRNKIATVYLHHHRGIAQRIMYQFFAKCNLYLHCKHCAIAYALSYALRYSV